MNKKLIIPMQIQIIFGMEQQRLYLMMKMEQLLVKENQQIKQFFINNEEVFIFVRVG